jgi:NADH-quinone oxidoreductase subunit C
MALDLSTLAARVAAKFGEGAVGHSHVLGELTLHTDIGNILAVLEFLKSDGECRFVSFIDITAADYPERDHRFDVVYHLLSPYQNARVRLKLQVGEGDVVPSATGLFRGAEWYEREVFDLYGIMFSSHPDLRRILTDYGFQGHPLRKDFPTTGYVEVRYDDELKRVVYEPVKLVQEFRQFDYLSPWEGTDYVLPGDEKAKQ